MPACIIRPASLRRAILRARQPHAVRLLRDAWRRASPLRQAHRRNQRRRTHAAGSHPCAGQINGVEGLELIGGNAARDLEPELSCVAALVSPATGIIDGHAYMLALQGDLEAHGGTVAFETPVERHDADAERLARAFRRARAGQLEVDAVINCAGLSAQQVARADRGLSGDAHPQAGAGQGQLFRLCGRPAFTRLIYPTPVDGGLGVHVTLDLAGRMRFGPDVEWIDDQHYEVDPARAASFYARIRTYWPGLPEVRWCPIIPASGRS